MHRRLSTAEKGKAVALEHRPAPRTARVRLSEPDNSALLKKHSLTLIGKVTNPSTQKVWSLIPFFIEHSKADIPPVGSDLGSGMFQFQFELESDLVTVLAKQPYHYARWMIILERWVPTLSPTFPSMIPFWIKIQGIPVHLWTEEAARQIGEDIGTYETAEVTSLSFRMRVHVNGRLPLIKSTILEYPNGDEVSATLVYEKLERHCSKCCRLDHEIRDCLEAKHEKKALLATQGDMHKSKDHSIAKEPPLHWNRNEREDSRRPLSRREDHSRPPSRSQHQQRSHLSTARGGVTDPYHRGRASDHQEWQPKDHSNNYQARRSEDRHSYRREDYHRDVRGNFRGDSHSVSSPKDNHHHRYQGKNTEAYPPRNRGYGSKEDGTHPIGYLNSKEHGSPWKERENALPHAAMEEAIDEVRGVMAQYANCADPAESAARRERVRQAEAKGQIEESAAQIVRASLTRKTTSDSQMEKSPTSEERVPVADRLGPVNLDNSLENNTESFPSSERRERVPVACRIGLQGANILAEPEGETAPDQIQKRKPGIPPGKKKIIGSLVLLPGASSRKRKVQQINQPKCRKKLHIEAKRKGTKGARDKGETDRVGAPREADSNNSDNVPICNLIPRTTRRRMDFRIQSNLVP